LRVSFSLILPRLSAWRITPSLILPLLKRGRIKEGEKNKDRRELRRRRIKKREENITKK